MKKIPVKELKTKRLLIRRFTPDDVDAVFSYASLPKVTKYVLWPTHKTRWDTRAFFHETFKQYKSGNSFSFAVEDLNTGKVIGSCGFVPDAERLTVFSVVEIGYVFHPDYWGNGYCTEVVKALISYAFRKLKVKRVQACCNMKNIGSARVMEKVGMQHEGLLRKYMKVKGKHWDIDMYSIIDSEFKKHSSKKAKR